MYLTEEKDDREGFNVRLAISHRLSARPDDGPVSDELQELSVSRNSWVPSFP
jgi:hypothetical protein